MNIADEEIATRLVDAIDAVAEHQNVGTVGHIDRRRVLLVVGEGGPSTATRDLLINTIQARDCLVTVVDVAEANADQIREQEFGVVLMLGSPGKYAKNIGIDELPTGFEKMRLPEPIERFGFETQRIGKGQRKANRHDRWKGPQGPGRHY